MSEIISHVQLPGSLSEQYTELDFMEEQDGGYGFYGRDKGGIYRKCKEAEVLEGFGHDISQKQAVNATWLALESDNPVKTVGIIGKLDGETYYKVEESDNGIPGSQLEWLSDEQPLETEAISGSKESIESIVKTIFAPLSERLDKLEAENQTLKGRKEELEEQVRNLMQQIENAASGNSVADTGALAEGKPINTDHPLAGAKLKPGASIGASRDSASPVLAPEPDPETEEFFRPTIYKERRGLRRVTGAIGDFMLRRQVEAQNGLFYINERRQHRPVEVSEEVAETYSTCSERTGEAALGGLAIGAVIGGVVAYYLWGRHTGHHDHTITQTITNSHTETVTIPASGGASGAIVHNNLETWNAASGNGSVAISLPKGYDLVKGSNGYHEIVKTNGQVVLDHIKMNSSGAINQDTLDRIKSKGLIKAGQTHLRYFDNTGPSHNPNLHGARNPGYNTHTVTILRKA